MQMGGFAAMAPWRAAVAVCLSDTWQSTKYQFLKWESRHRVWSLYLSCLSHMTLAVCSLPRSSEEKISK